MDCTKGFLEYELVREAKTERKSQTIRNLDEFGQTEIYSIHFKITYNLTESIVWKA